MKYLTITKTYPANYKVDDPSYSPFHWFLRIKDEYTNDYKYRKYNKLAEKAVAVLNGEKEILKVNKTVFDITGSKFTYDGSKVYFLTVNDIPIYFLVRTYKGKWVTTSHIIPDEDIELFESYGYEIDDSLVFKG